MLTIGIAYGVEHFTYSVLQSGVIDTLQET